MLEPRVMHVLLTLADAGGAVVTRDDFIEQCWDGQIVGDDSLNRAISELRRCVREVGADLSIETIPKIGYRLSFPPSETTTAVQESTARRGWYRRELIVGTAAIIAAGAGVYGWRRAPTRDPRVEALLGRARGALRDRLPDSMQQGIGFLLEAVALAPADAAAWGLLALAWCNVAELAPGEQIAAAVKSCEEAFNRALALDPEQPEALAARALLPPIFGDWFGAQQRLEAVLRRHPDQLDALDGLGLLFFSAGLTRAGEEISARLATIDPLSPVFQYRHAYRQWAIGDLSAADRTIDRALQLWPRHPAVWYARFQLFALTGRIDAAQQFMRGTPATPPVLSAKDLGGWGQTLAALRSGRANDHAAAVEANLAAARSSMVECTNAILALTTLGAIDVAFDVTEAYLLDRGPMQGAIDRSPQRTAVNDQRWRKTMTLWVPATARLRADPRFSRLCVDIGFTDYWRKSGVHPDCGCA
jgi:tetratricopeptide (TPR) repeat protein